MVKSPKPINSSQLSTEEISVDDLTPHPRNYRQHPDDQITHLMKRIEDFGVYRAILISRENVILAGHGLYKACVKLGMKSVPVIRFPFDANDPRALKLLTGDNEVEHLAEQDDRLLSEILKQIKEDDYEGLIGTGFDEMQLANLLYVTRSEHEIADFDEAAHWVGMPEYENVETPLKATVSFRNETDRQAFLKLLNQDMPMGKNHNMISLWYPEKGRDDNASVRFETGD